MGKRQAVQKAKSYLKVSAFSKQRLLEQLMFEGFSMSAASYGVKHCGADWKKQAVKKAKSYMELFTMSKKKLIAQLEFDGFTAAQAKYAAKKLGVK